MRGITTLKFLFNCWAIPVEIHVFSEVTPDISTKVGTWVVAKEPEDIISNRKENKNFIIKHLY